MIYCRSTITTPCSLASSKGITGTVGLDWKEWNDLTGAYCSSCHIWNKPYKERKLEYLLLLSGCAWYIYILSIGFQVMSWCIILFIFFYLAAIIDLICQVLRSLTSANSLSLVCSTCYFSYSWSRMNLQHAWRPHVYRSHPGRNILQSL